MTDFIIKLKLSYDSATLAISNVFAEKHMKHIYLGMYWLSTLFLIIKFKIDGEIRGLYFLAAAFICLRAFKYTTNYLNNSNKIIKYFIAPSILIALIAYSTSNSSIFNSEIEKNDKMMNPDDCK